MGGIDISDTVQRAKIFRYDVSGRRVFVDDGIDTPHSPLLRLELGKWSIALLNDELARIYALSGNCGDRNLFWASALLGTKTAPESSLPPLRRYEARVRLESFDCITLIYTCLALARSKTFDDFVRELIDLRYAAVAETGVDNDPEEGNFLDFACESLLREAVSKGVVEDITPFLRTAEKIDLSTILTGHPRQAKFDSHGSRVRPHFGEWAIRRTFLNKQGLRDSIDDLQRGDILLVTRGGALPTLVHHCIIAALEPGLENYIHASFNGYWYSQDARAALQASPERFAEFQCGVSYGAIHVGDENAITTADRSLHPYTQSQLRPLPNALDVPFVGALVLRPI